MADILARVEGFPAPGGLLDLSFERGTVVRLSGRNGSGKTSLLRCLAGLPSPLVPQRVILGSEAPDRLPAAVLAARLAMVHQDARDGLVGLTAAGEHRFRGRPVPPGASRQDVATLSAGEARRLALALADADLLLLDEPTEGLDAEGVAKLRARIEAARTRCVVIVDHEGVLADLADRHIVLSDAAPEPAWSLPAGGTEVVLESPPMDLALGRRTASAPALRLAAGLHCIAGPNGAGKSTWLRRLAGIEGAPARVMGRAARPGVDVRWLSPHPADHLGATTVAQELDGAGHPHRLVPAALMARHPLRLSGGEQKRVALARVLGTAAPAYLLDEPEAHLDAQGRQGLQEWLAERIGQGSVVVAATHDPHLLGAARSITRLEGEHPAMRLEGT